MIKESLSVVLPAFNEEENIKEAVQGAFDFLRQNFEDFEIIVVDDGSKDRTHEICSGLKSVLGDALKVLRHTENRGYGAALRTGLSAAQKDLLFYTDADNQYDIRQVPEFFEHLRDHDLVIGYRLRRQDPFSRIINSRVYNFLVNLLFGLKVRDVNCSFKLFRRSSLAQLSIERDLFFADAELLIKAELAGFKIQQLPVRHYPRKKGQSTVRFSHIFSTFQDMFAMHDKLKRESDAP